MLTREPTGVGLDVPAWLMALEEEVATVTQGDVDAGPDDPLGSRHSRRRRCPWKRPNASWKSGPPGGSGAGALVKRLCNVTRSVSEEGRAAF